VCKLANLFGSEWGLEPGELVRVGLPAHWQACAVTVAAWTAGLTVTFGDTRQATRSFVHWDDFASEVPGQPDVLLLPTRVTGADLALLGATRTATHADLVSRGLAAAAASGLQKRGRLLTDLNPASEAGVDIALLAPLVTGASIVLVLEASVERRERIAAQEMVTCTRWA
jgi:hypothetical protein